MNCELCGKDCTESFGDVEGAIVCPDCMGWNGGEPDPEVKRFLKKHGEWIDEWEGNDFIPDAGRIMDKPLHPEEWARIQEQKAKDEAWQQENGARLEEERRKWMESPEYQRALERNRRERGASRKADRVSHPRWRLWMMAVSDSKEKGPSRLTKSINYWGAQKSRKKGDYNDVLVGVLNDVGTYLNMSTSQVGDYRIAIPMVAKKFNLDANILKTLFYETGSLAQSLLDFEMDTSKQGHADSLLRIAEEYQSTGAEFNAAKNATLEMAKSMRTKNPEHRKTILKIVSDATNYDQLRGGLMQAKLSFSGMGVNMPTASRQATITVVLPWKYKNTIKAAQNAARTGNVRVKGSASGFTVQGSIHSLAELGIVKEADARAMMGPVRQAGITTQEGRAWLLPGNERGLEILVRANARTASLVAQQLVKTRGLLFATVYDVSGQAHTAIRKAAENDLEFTDDDGDFEYMDEGEEGRHVVLEGDIFCIAVYGDGYCIQSSHDDDFYSGPYTSVEEAKAEAEEFALKNFGEPIKWERTASKRATRTASLTSSLKKIWEDLAEEFSEALDEDTFDVAFVHEVVGDNASNMLKGADLTKWSEMDAEEQVNALHEAFPGEQCNVGQVQERHLDRRTRGAAKKACCGGCDDPTDVKESDDSFLTPLQEMILGPSTHQEEPAVFIIELPQ